MLQSPWGTAEEAGHILNKRAVSGKKREVQGSYNYLLHNTAKSLGLAKCAVSISESNNKEV